MVIDALAMAVRYYDDAKAEDEAHERRIREETLADIKRKGIKGFPPVLLPFVSLTPELAGRVDMLPYYAKFTLRANGSDPYSITGKISIYAIAPDVDDNVIDIVQTFEEFTRRMWQIHNSANASE